MSDLFDIQSLVQKRIPSRVFTGFAPDDPGEVPANVADNAPFSESNDAVKGGFDVDISFKDVITLLPKASYRSAAVKNKNVEEDGTTIDRDRAESVLEGADIDTSALPDSDPDRDNEYDPLSGYRVIVDPRREALAALLDRPVNYTWTVKTNRYTIHNPREIFEPLVATFTRKAERNVFGWFELRKWGGRVDIYLLFPDYVIPTPDGSEDLYNGIHVTYEHTGHSSVYCTQFAYEPGDGNRHYLDEPSLRKEHRGSTTRSDYRAFYDDVHSQLVAEEDSSLAQTIKEASTTTLDFSKRDYSLEEFYAYHDLGTYAEDAAERAEAHSAGDDIYTFWTIYYGMIQELNDSYQGDNMGGQQYSTYAEITASFLRSPEAVTEEAEEMYRLENDPNFSQEDLYHGSSPSANANVPGFSTEDELDMSDRIETVTDKQSTLGAEF